MRGIAVLVLLASDARADRRLNALRSDPPCRASGRVEPAAVEWTGWVGVGTGTPVVAVRAGLGLDFELMQVTNPYRYGGPIEVRWGPWLAGETTFDSALVEGGLALDVGQTKHASFGTYTLRVGGGVDDDRRPLASLSFLGGVRYVPTRYADRDRCDKRRLAFASGARVFGTVRMDADENTVWLIGIELEPTWALPPYSLGKLAGADPHW